MMHQFIEQASLPKRSKLRSRVKSVVPRLPDLFVIVLLAMSALPVLRWALIDAVWAGDPGACNAEAAGACWSFIREKIGFILFGFFQPSERWRPVLVILVLGGLLSASAIPRLWSRWLGYAWLGCLVVLPLVMAGGGWTRPVATNDWGGLPVTLMVSVASVLLAFPLAVALALARQSDMAIFRWMAVGYVEVLRAVPLIVVLYVAMLIVPMALPKGLLLDKLLRAEIGITVFTSAYLAEVVRAGLQTLPAGQALGLTRWQTQRLVILPQALRAVIPAIVNLAIGIMLNTSLLAVIGIYDVLNTAKASAADPNWLGFYTEAYLLVAAIYISISYGVSRYSRWLERYLRSH